MLQETTRIGWLLAAGFVLLSLISFTQIHQYNFGQIDSLQKKQTRNTLVYIYTDWCKYCKQMENTTFRNKGIQQFVNENYWFVKLNAEEKQSIFFNNYTFAFKPQGVNTGTHELAIALGTIENKLTFPTICILNTENEIVYQIDGFISSKDLDKILRLLAK